MYEARIDKKPNNVLEKININEMNEIQSVEPKSI